MVRVGYADHLTRMCRVSTEPGGETVWLRVRLCFWTQRVWQQMLRQKGDIRRASLALAEVESFEPVHLLYPVN